MFEIVFVGKKTVFFTRKDLRYRLGCDKSPFLDTEGFITLPPKIQDVMCEKMIVQIYEIQKPGDVGPVVAAGVDHVGTVLLSEDGWKVPEIRDTVRETGRLGQTSSLIQVTTPLFPSSTRPLFAATAVSRHCRGESTPAAR